VVDLVFLAVPDRAIEAVSEQLLSYLSTDTTIVHTSGATPLSAISSRFSNRGVLWPIRSLRVDEPVAAWRSVPLVIQASNAGTQQQLLTLARSLSDTVSELDDRQRAQLHLAAVFSNNFVTALYEIAHRLCKAHGIPFDLLLPIIRHTALRQDGSSPRLRQTGAAARGDTATMDRHLALIDQPEYTEVYRMMSALILQYRLPQHDPHLRRQANDDLED
jgi:predicted short-subunit dehydrogenase-like oxidoreductase (DUF2520 family)